MARKVEESLENYLENILILSEDTAPVRAVDLAAAMGFSKPSVSRAIHLMADRGYLTIGEDGALTLTDSGLQRASLVLERHRFLTAYFRQLGVDEDTAAEDACSVEHVISETTYQAMRQHYEQLPAHRPEPASAALLRANARRAQREI